MADLEKDITGAFLLNSKLFNEVDCPVNLFQGPHCRLIFKCLKAAHGNGRPIDSTILVMDLDKKVPPTFILSLTDGYPKSEAPIDVVQEKVRRLKNERLGGKFFEEAKAQGEFMLKGMPADMSKIEILYNEWKKINKSEEQLRLENLPMSVEMSGIDEKEIHWLWPNYIPSESLTLINGDPNAGKSWFALDMACRVSRGLAWPDLSTNIQPSNTYYMTYEDSLSQIIKKRIRTLGGDPKRIIAYNSKHPLYLYLSEEEGMTRLEAEIVRIGNVRLLIIDPILDFMSAANPNAIEVVRALLTPIISMCERHNIACLMIGHLNKDQLKSAIYRAGGSTGGWMGKARSAFLIARDPDDKMKRYLMPVKCNYAYPEPLQMEFEIINGRLEYNKCDVNIEEVLNPAIKGRPPSASLEVKQVLADMFREKDEIPSAEIEERAKAMGIKERTLNTVKKQEGYFSECKKGKRDEADYWIWKKPLFKGKK